MKKWSFLMLCVVRYACYADGDNGMAERSFPIWHVAAGVHTGFLIYHHNNMHALAERRPYAAELSLSKHTYGEKEWQSFFGYPEYGVSLVMFDFGSPTYLGKGYGLYPFMNFFLRNNDQRLNITVKIGGGAVYIDKMFDRHTNYKNITISTHLNALLRLQFNAYVRITDELSAFTGVGLTHFSNGTYKKPNAGLNFITLNAGFGYVFGDRPLLTSKAAEVIDKKWSYRMYLSGGIKEIFPVGGNKYLASGLSLEFSRSHLPFTRFGGALDVFYDPSDYVLLQNDDLSRLQTVKVGLAAGYEPVFGRLSTIVQTGIYLYAKNTEFGNFYQRLAVRYAVNSKITIHLGLKTHLGQADYIELAYGYRIR